MAALARPPHVPSRYLEAGRDYPITDDLRRLLLAAKVHPMGPLVIVAATTGLRLGEQLGLAWSDLDEKAGTLTVRRSLARTPSGWALVPVPDGTNIPLVLDLIQVRHIHATGSCTSLVAVLNGVESRHVQ